MPATPGEATSVQSDTARDTPDRRSDADAPKLTVGDVEEIARVLSATDEDDVPLFGRLPA
jgi:hypothetical protein